MFYVINMHNILIYVCCEILNVFF